MIFFYYCEYLGHRNSVSMRKRCTQCIAPKLHEAHFEARGPKLRGAQLEGSKNLPSIFAPQSFGPLNQKLDFLNFLKVSFVNHCYFRDLYNQYDHYEKRIISRDGTFKDHTASITIILIEYITTTQ